MHVGSQIARCEIVGCVSHGILVGHHRVIAQIIICRHITGVFASDWLAFDITKALVDQGWEIEQAGEPLPNMPMPVITKNRDCFNSGGIVTFAN